MNRKILFILNHSIHVRNFIASGIVSRFCEQGYKPIVLLDSVSAKHLGEINQFEAIELESVYFPSKFKLWVRGLIREMSLVSRLKLNQTYETKIDHAKKKSIKAKVKYLIIEFLSQFIQLEKFAVRLESFFKVPNACVEFLESHQIDDVFYASIIHDEDQYLDFLKAAKFLGIRRTCAVSSWDNLTSKGFFVVPPDRLLVWGKLDKENAISEHNFKEDQVFVTGAPQFDQYFDDAIVYSREKFFNERGLNPNSSLVLFAGTTLNRLAEEPKILEALSSEISKLNKDVIIWYRPHPRANNDQLESYKKIKGIYIDDQFLSQRNRGGSGYSLRGHDLNHYKFLLNSTSVVVSAFSTMVIEAALHGKPSVLISFSMDQSRTTAVSDYSKYSHLKEILKWSHVVRSTSMEDLVKNVCFYLEKDPKEYEQKLKESAGNIINNMYSNASDEYLNLFQ